MKFESEYLEELKNKFYSIKQMGFIQSNRSHNTGIGKTFEDLLGKIEDNKANADFGDIEIKTQRESSSSLVTLFSKSPNYPRGANTILRENFGYPSPENPELKILHTTIYNNNFSNVKNKYYFSFKVDRINDEIKILVFDYKTKNILLDNVTYSFSVIKQAIEKKIKKIAYIKANTKTEFNGSESFHYLSMELFHNPSFNKFIELLEKQIIAIDIRIGVYKNPLSKTYGKTHDHGTAFRISSDHLEKLFTRTIIE